MPRMRSVPALLTEYSTFLEYSSNIPLVPASDMERKPSSMWLIAIHILVLEIKSQYFHRGSHGAIED